MELHKTIELNNGTTVKLRKDVIMLQHMAHQIDAKLGGFAKEYKLELIEDQGSDSKREDAMPMVMNTNERMGFFALGKELTNGSIAELRDAAAEQEISVSLVYCSDPKEPNSCFAIVQNALVLQKTDKNEPFLKKISKDIGAQVNAQKSQYLTNKLYIDLPLNSKADAIDLYFQLAEEKIPQMVFFEQVPMISPTCAMPNDTFFVSQWNLDQIQWHKDYSNSRETSVVAVLDLGVDLSHPDINFASNGLNLGTMLPDGSPTGNHGTPCAGIAAATVNNSEGVAGVSGRSKVLPIATTNWSDIQIAMGINYAAQFGADVISMSFGVYDSWNLWDYSVIDSEIIYATNQGTFLCAASGNENQALNRYPGKHPLVMCVGGSNRDDVRKAVNDGSIETFWGACYGYENYEGNMTGVSVVAPCLEIPATDRTGGSGYTNTDYTLRFNGTSSATPIVAGLAALIKGHIPSAGNSLVRKIIEQSADKIGGYNYAYNTDFPNGSWTQHVGHGRINVRKAMRMVETYCCSGGCDDYNLGNHIASGSTPAGSTDWQQYGNNSGIYLDVDTSSGNFSSTPKYLTSIGGSSSHWATTGATSIYEPGSNSFRVYVKWSNGNSLTPAQANSAQWHINWIGIEG